MVFRFAAVALLAGLGCYRAPKIPSAAVTDLGCVYDPVTEQLRVCLEPGMVGACATYGPRCAGGVRTAERDLDVPVYRMSPHYEEPVVQPVPPAPEAYAPPVELGGEVGYAGSYGVVGGDGGYGGGGGGSAPVVDVAPPTRPPPPGRGRPVVTGGFPVPPRGHHPPPMPPPRGHHVPPPGVVVTPPRPLGVPPVGRPDVAAPDQPGGGPIILRRAPNGQLMVAPPAQHGRPMPEGGAQPPPRRPAPRKR